MMKKTFKLASLSFVLFGCAVASEFRPSLNLERGPQRYDMHAERDHESDWDINVWSIAYARNANKAFSNGTKSTPLTSLIFGKDHFKASDAFGANDVTNPANQSSEEFNSNLHSVPMYPRITYSETGINVGAGIGYRVWEGKGNVGIKINVPFKQVRMERDNTAETAELGGAAINVIQADRTNNQVPVPPPAAAGAGEVVLGLKTTPIDAALYKLSAVKNLPFISSAGQSTVVNYETNGVGQYKFNIVGQPYNVNTALDPSVNAGGVYDNGTTPYVLFYNPNSNVVPTIGARAIKLNDTLTASNRLVLNAVNSQVAMTTADVVVGGGAGAVGANYVASNALAAGVLGVGGAGVGTVADFDTINMQNQIIAVGSAVQTPVAQIVVDGFTPTAALEGQKAGAITHTSIDRAVNLAAGNLPIAPLTALVAGVAPVPNTLYTIPRQATIAAAQEMDNFLNDNADNLWLMSVADSTGSGKANPGIDTALQSLYNRYSQQTAEQWLWMNGYTMQTDQRTSLGDITINPFYEHTFSDSLQGSLYVHVLIPTGGSTKTGKNPFKARLGNDNHVELGGGASVGWQALDWMNVRADVFAAYALPATERVNVPFKNATIKGLGPVMDAKIDYTRVKFSLDTTMVHPKASALATTIGYDFEYKTKDSVSLKKSKFQFDTLANDENSWFGGFWDNAPAVRAFTLREFDLDSAVLSKNTERMSHNFRVESSWHATEYLSIFTGGTSTFAGQYVAKVTSVYGGMNVKF